MRKSIIQLVPQATRVLPTGVEHLLQHRSAALPLSYKRAPYLSLTFIVVHQRPAKAYAVRRQDTGWHLNSVTIFLCSSIHGNPCMISCSLLRIESQLHVHKSVVGLGLNFLAERSLDLYRKWLPYIVNTNPSSSNVNTLFALGITEKQNKTPVV